MEQKRRSAAVVREVAALTAQAKSRKATVAALVATNQETLDDAQNELEADQAAYDRLQRAGSRDHRQDQGPDREGQGCASEAGQLGPATFKLAEFEGFHLPGQAPAGSPFGLRFHPILHYWRMHWGTDFGAACGTPI